MSKMITEKKNICIYRERNTYVKECRESNMQNVSRKVVKFGDLNPTLNRCFGKMILKF